MMQARAFTASHKAMFGTEPAPRLSLPPRSPAPPVNATPFDDDDEPAPAALPEQAPAPSEPVAPRASWPSASMPAAPAAVANSRPGRPSSPGSPTAATSASSRLRVRPRRPPAQRVGARRPRVNDSLGYLPEGRGTRSHLQRQHLHAAPLVGQHGVFPRLLVASWPSRRGSVAHSRPRFSPKGTSAIVLGLPGSHMPRASLHRPVRQEAAWRPSDA